MSILGELLKKVQVKVGGVEVGTGDPLRVLVNAAVEARMDEIVDRAVAATLPKVIAWLKEEASK